MDFQYHLSQLTFEIIGSVPSLSASTSLVRLAVLSHSQRRGLTVCVLSLCSVKCVVRSNKKVFALVIR